jgi:hypothetical protein
MRRKHSVSETGSVPIFRGERRETFLALSEGPNRVDVSLLSPQDGNRPSFQNVVFSSYLEFSMMNKVQKSSNSECYIPSYIYIYILPVALGPQPLTEMSTKSINNNVCRE